MVDMTLRLVDSILLAEEIETLLLADTPLALSKVSEEEGKEGKKLDLCRGRREKKEEKERESIK